MRNMIHSVLIQIQLIRHRNEKSVTHLMTSLTFVMAIQNKYILLSFSKQKSMADMFYLIFYNELRDLWWIVTQRKWFISDDEWHTQYCYFKDKLEWSTQDENKWHFSTSTLFALTSIVHFILYGIRILTHHWSTWGFIFEILLRLIFPYNKFNGVHS